MFTDKSHFIIPQDYLGPEFNWVTYGIQSSRRYLFLSLHLPFLPYTAPVHLSQKMSRVHSGGELTQFSKTSGKCLELQLIKPACQTPKWRSNMVRFYVESTTKFSLAKSSIFFPAAHPVTTWHSSRHTLTSETIH